MQVDTDMPSQKRKRSASHEPQDQDAPPSKTNQNPRRSHINYLARQQTEDLPLVTSNDPLAAVSRVLGEYSGVLDRQESLARNLGARSLGPVLIKRFERLFEHAPHIVKSEGKNPPVVTWLDVVDFAEQQPEQFALSNTNGEARSCEIWLRRSLVAISEEDFMLIKSGMPQKLIPPQPIAEDEEKELGTLQILEENVGHILTLADQVAARARQLSHQMQVRKKGIIDRRIAKTAVSGASILRTASPSNVALINGGGAAGSSPTQSPTLFLGDGSSRTDSELGLIYAPDERLSNPSFVSPELREGLLRQFTTLGGRSAGRSNGTAASKNMLLASPNSATDTPQTPQHDDQSYTQPASATTQQNQAALPTTPASAGAKPRSANSAKDDGGPFKAEMVLRVERLPKGALIVPPCDRCRRLGIECTKNLTACLGCTKKHAKCVWRDVSEAEMRGTAHLFESLQSGAAPGGGVPQQQQQQQQQQQHPATDASQQQEAMQQLPAGTTLLSDGPAPPASNNLFHQHPEHAHLRTAAAARGDSQSQPHSQPQQTPRGNYDPTGPEALLLLHQQQQQHHQQQQQQQQGGAPYAAQPQPPPQTHSPVQSPVQLQIQREAKREAQREVNRAMEVAGADEGLGMGFGLGMGLGM